MPAGRIGRISGSNPKSNNKSPTLATTIRWRKDEAEQEAKRLEAEEGIKRAADVLRDSKQRELIAENERRQQQVEDKRQQLKRERELAVVRLKKGEFRHVVLYTCIHLVGIFLWRCWVRRMGLSNYVSFLVGLGCFSQGLPLAAT